MMAPDVDVGFLVKGREDRDWKREEEGQGGRRGTSRQSKGRSRRGSEVFQLVVLQQQNKRDGSGPDMITDFRERTEREGRPGRTKRVGRRRGGRSKLADQQSAKLRD